MDASKKRCMKYRKLQELVLEGIKASLQPTPGQTAHETEGTSLLGDDHGEVSSESDESGTERIQAEQIGSEKIQSEQIGTTIFGSGGNQTATKMNGDIPDDALRRHQEAMLDAISIRDLPKNEVYGMENGTSVVKHDLRYANFFK